MSPLATSTETDALTLLRRHGERLHEYFVQIRARHNQAPPRLVEAMSSLAGDAIVTMAFEIIATDADPAVVPTLVRELAHASGPEGMIGGQVLDIDGETQSLTLPQLQQVHRMKTGALLTASCRL